MTVDLSELALQARSGFPAEIAYLRAAHPRPAWRQHGNFGALAEFWLQVHDRLRSQAADLERATNAFREANLSGADFCRVFVQRFNHFLQHLQGHDQIEDRAYYPRFRCPDTRMLAGFDLLAKDHGAIDNAMVAAVEGANAMLAAVLDGAAANGHAIDAYGVVFERLFTLLIRHLADEEDLLIPALFEYGEHRVG